MDRPLHRIVCLNPHIAKQLIGVTLIGGCVENVPTVPDSIAYKCFVSNPNQANFSGYQNSHYLSLIILSSQKLDQDHNYES